MSVEIERTGRHDSAQPSSAAEAVARRRLSRALAATRGPPPAAPRLRPHAACLLPCAKGLGSSWRMFEKLWLTWLWHASSARTARITSRMLALGARRLQGAGVADMWGNTGAALAERRSASGKGCQPAA